MICPSFQAGALYPATDVLRLGTPVPGYVRSRIVIKKILFYKFIFYDSSLSGMLKKMSMSRVGAW